MNDQDSRAEPPSLLVQAWRALHTRQAWQSWSRMHLLVLCALALLGFGLRYPALLTGFMSDDVAQLGMLDGSYPVPRAPLDLFSFSNGTGAEVQRLIDNGFFPWWSAPHLQLAVLRPAASAMIWLDWTLFGEHAFAYHLHSLCWWFAMLAAIGALFRRVLTPPVGVLAFAFLVLDEAHGVPLAWIANRSVLVSTTLGVLALLAYLRLREHGRSRDLALVLIAFFAALGFGEYALCVAAYALAYELLEAQGPLATRLLALWPLAAPTLLYVLLHVLLGHLPHDSGLYIDPLGEPGAVLVALVQRLPVLYADLMLGVRADYWTFGLPSTYQWVSRGYLSTAWLLGPEPWRQVHVLLGCVALGLVAVCLRLTPPSAQRANTRWLFLGSVLSLLPVVASFPSSRLLLVPLIGFAPMLASFVISSLAELTRLRARSNARVRGSALLASLITIHQLSLPPLLSHDEVTQLAAGADATRRALAHLPGEPSALPTQRVIVLSAPGGSSGLYLALTRARLHLPLPKACWTLSTALGAHVLQRDSERGFTLTPFGDAVFLASASEQMFRTPRLPLSVGDTVTLNGAHIRVLRLLRGRPKLIGVRFDVPLEDPSLLFVLPTRQGIVRFPMPAIGASVLVPPADLPP